MSFPNCSWLRLWVTAVWITCAGQLTWAEPKHGVYELGPNNFNDTINHFSHVMVKFYAPWCSHCQAMSPAYATAGQRLIDEGDQLNSRLARVDATQHADLARRYEVSGFPTLIVFSHGQVYSRYYGAREAGDIVRYMQSLNMPLYLGWIYRGYFILDGVYREILEELLPPGNTRLLYFLQLMFPVLAFGPLGLMAIGCVFVCAAIEDPDNPDSEEESDASAQEKEVASETVAKSPDVASETADTSEGEKSNVVKKRRSKKMD